MASKKIQGFWGVAIAFSVLSAHEVGAATAAENVATTPTPENAAASIAKMRTQFSEVAQLLQAAVDKGDVMKKNCVNVQVTSIKGMIRVAEGAELKLQVAVAEKKDTDARFEMDKINIAAVKTTDAKAKAQACMGMMAFGTDENQTVEVNEPDDLPKGDPSTPATLPRVETKNSPASPTSP